MKAACLVGTLISLYAFAGCKQPSDRYEGVEQPPSHQSAQNPATLPTTNAAKPETPPADEPTGAPAAPAENPNTAGTTRSPNTIIEQAGGAAGTTVAPAGAVPKPGAEKGKRE